MNWALNIRMVSSSATLTQRRIPCTPLSTLLTIGSRVAFIFCFCVLYHSARLHACLNERRAFASCLTKHPLSFVSYYQYPVPCRISPLQCPDHGLRGHHPLPRNSIVRLWKIENTCSRPRLALLSKLSSRLAYISLCHPALKESFVPFAVDNLPLCSGRTTDIPPERS